jgi:hypothetical protein
VSNQSSWEPPKALSLDEVLQLDRQVASMPDLSIRVHEDIFRIRELEMDWDIGVMVYEPENTNLSTSRRRFGFQIRRTDRAHSARQICDQSG